MAAKALLVLCAQALFIQGIYSQQCAGNIGAAIAAENLAFGGLGGPYGYGQPLGLANYGLANSFAPSSGGGFAVTSASPIAPTGITVISENAIEGALAINGNLPFLGAVALEGALPSAGAGGINYGCGSGAVGIVSEGIAPAAPAYGAINPAVAAFGPGAGLGLGAGLGYGAGLPGRGFGGLGLGLGCGGAF